MLTTCWYLVPIPRYNLLTVATLLLELMCLYEDFMPWSSAWNIWTRSSKQREQIVGIFSGGELFSVFGHKVQTWLPCLLQLIDIALRVTESFITPEYKWTNWSGVSNFRAPFCHETLPLLWICPMPVVHHLFSVQLLQSVTLPPGCFLFGNFLLICSWSKIIQYERRTANIIFTLRRHGIAFKLSLLGGKNNFL